jgi:hypothetical protein
MPVKLMTITSVSRFTVSWMGVRPLGSSIFTPNRGGHRTLTVKGEPKMWKSSLIRIDSLKSPGEQIEYLQQQAAKRSRGTALIAAPLGAVPTLLTRHEHHGARKKTTTYSGLPYLGTSHYGP